VSSTNRGGKRSESDNYPTPPYCVHRFLEDDLAKTFLPSGNWLEPGAGDGSIIRAANHIRTDVVWTALELREECREDLTAAVGPRGLVLIEDYLDPPSATGLRSNYSVALGNPPYRLAGEFIERSLQISEVVALLLRVNFLASAKRNTFMRSNVPDVYVLPNRPSFRGTGTDSPEYAWFVWAQQRCETAGRLRILHTTPIAERKPSKKRAEGLGKRDRAKRPLPSPKRLVEQELVSIGVCDSEQSAPGPSL
jgi:hypothetical protein